MNEDDNAPEVIVVPTTIINRRVAVFDPGQTTGYFSCTGIDYKARTIRDADSHEIMWGNHECEIRSVLMAFKPEVIVIETFSLYRGKAKQQIGSTFPSVEIIGVIKAYVSEHMPNTVIVMQPAWAKERTIRAYEDSVKGVVGPHCRDAMRHFVYYAVTSMIPTMSQRVKGAG